ncbi:MAG: DUF1311 domain-containing protein [Burkholderiales bacterium]|nr:DUF1311 domain-containing protein [Burkholderiales bacterium]
MRLNLGAALLLILTSALPSATFAQANSDAETACYDGVGAHGAYMECLYATAASSEGEVADAEAKVVAALKAWDMDEKYRRQALAAFKEASTKFKQWRAAQCRAMAALAGGGNGDDPLRDSCRIELNRARVRQLSSYVRQLKP